ncbi:MULTISPECIES: condensin complex protein MksE [unclassified Shewanella]|uniref:condensin complex protein MksE n=1 Tax=unclassified Shewanella TaxID=196818 RepID=UPI0035529729
MSERFESCIETLLNGDVVCEASQPELYRYLLDHENLNSIQKFLHQIGRKIITTRDKAGFFCAYKDLSNPKHRADVKRQFEIIQASFEGLILWLRLVRRTDPDSRPIEAGYRLLESELLAAIEDSASLNSQLDEIAHRLRRDHKSTESKSKLRGILKYLTEHGFLISVGGSGAVYIATAKWSLVYDQLDFICQFEGIDTSQPKDEVQKEMF